MYVNNSPLNFVDPSGHKPQCDGDGWCGDQNSPNISSDQNPSSNKDKKNEQDNLESFNDENFDNCIYTENGGFGCAIYLSTSEIEELNKLLTINGHVALVSKLLLEY